MKKFFNKIRIFLIKILGGYERQYQKVINLKDIPTHQPNYIEKEEYKIERIAVYSEVPRGYGLAYTEGYKKGLIEDCKKKIKESIKEQVENFIEFRYMDFESSKEIEGQIFIGIKKQN